MPVWRALESGVTRVALAAHRRWGKDDVALHWTACSMMQRVGTYWHMLPRANQARKALWDAINPRTGRRRIDDAFPVELRRSTRENDMLIRSRTGSTWQVLGSDNYDSLVGSPPVGVVFSEYALADPSAWAFLRPILAENGGWAIFISTPRGNNHFRRMVDFARGDPQWFGDVLPVSRTQAIPVDVIEREFRELCAERGEDEARAIIAQEYECDFNAAIPGSYYGRLLTDLERSGRIGDFPVIPGVPVCTAWDLGIGDSTAIWFYQVLPGRVRIVDYVESHGVGLDWYARELRERGYDYGEHLLPHDVMVSDLGTGRRRIDLLYSLGIKARPLARQSVDDGIAAVRWLLPQCEVDAKRCERGLDALRAYHRDWSDKLLMYSDSPTHDWSSHAADAFRYLASGLREHMPAPARQQTIAQVWDNQPTIADMLKPIRAPEW